MADIKTKKTDESFVKFLNTVQDETKRKDCFAIAEMMKTISKCEPKMWGPLLLVLEVIIISMKAVTKEICA